MRRPLPLGMAALLALIVTGCAGSETPLSNDPTEATVVSQIGQTFDLKPGQTARVGGDGLLIGFRGVANDSRCAVDVQCVWAGDAEARISATTRGAQWTPLVLHTGVEPRSAEFQGRRITLVELKPAPRSGARIPNENYVVTLRVE